MAVEPQLNDAPIIVLMDSNLYLDSLNHRAEIVRASNVDEVAQLAVRSPPWLTIISGDTTDGRQLIGRLKRHPSTRTLALVAVETPISPEQKQPNSRTQADHHILRSALVEFITDRLNLLTSNVPLPDWMRDKLRKMLSQHRQQQSLITQLNEDVITRQDHIDALRTQVNTLQTKLVKAEQFVESSKEARKSAQSSADTAKSEALQASSQLKALSETLKGDDDEAASMSPLLLHAEAEALRMELVTLRGERDRYQDRINEFETAQDELLAQINALESQQIEWENERQAHKEERNGLFKKIEEIKENASQLLTEEDVHNRTIELHTELAQATEHKETAVLNELDALERMRDALQRADVAEDLAHEARQVRDEAIKARGEMEIEVEKARVLVGIAEQLEILQQEFDSQSKDNKELHDQIVELKQQSKQKQSEFEELEATLATSNAQIEQLEALKTTLQDELTELNERLDQSAEALAEAKHSHDGEVAQFNSEIERLTTTLKEKDESIENVEGCYQN